MKVYNTFTRAPIGNEEFTQNTIRKPLLYKITCFSKSIMPKVTRTLTLLLIGISLWAVCYFIFGEYVGLNSQMFRLIFMFILAYLAGKLTGVLYLPPLFGMLITGIVLRNIGFLHLTGNFLILSSILRETALACILTRAGLGLDSNDLKKLKWMVVRLSTIPCITEGLVVMIASHYLLDLTWIYGALLGSILGAISPAVVIPLLFALQEKGYGTDKGIPTLIIAAASFDDVISISSFGIIMGTIFSTDRSLLMNILNGPIGVIVGLVFGLVWGFGSWYFPNSRDHYVSLHRTILISLGGLLAMLGSEFIGFNGAGPLACILAPFIACLGWRRHSWSHEDNTVRNAYFVLWIFFEPIIFSLIGSEVDISVLNPSVVGSAVGTLFIALSARIFITMLVAFGGGYTWKEKFFISWAWFPKATVQAAIAPAALSMARMINSKTDETLAEKVLITGVLSILITAPVGAFLITLLGPICLPKQKNPTIENLANSSSDAECDTETKYLIDS